MALTAMRREEDADLWELRDECREVQRGINEVAGEFRACDAGIREGAALCGPRIRCVRAAVPDGGGAAATAVTEQQQL